jgi:predicted nucleic acid-binding Zn ribbon protein
MVYADCLVCERNVSVGDGYCSEERVVAKRPLSKEGKKSGGTSGFILLLVTVLVCYVATLVMAYLKH